jgi:7-cyano-7-deazaguanine reductase
MSSQPEPRTLLESFDNRTPGRDYTIQLTLPEFTCLCPRSGFPDFAILHVRYVPGPRCVELKSLKLYVNAFRNVGVFHEDVVNGILSDLVGLVAPRYCEVVGDFNVRGNIKTVVRAVHRDPDFSGQPQGWWAARDEHAAIHPVDDPGTTAQPLS